MLRRRLALLPLAALAASFTALAASPARADTSPVVVITDTDGFLQKHKLSSTSDLNAMHDKLLELYAATGLELPEIMSVWTTFPLGGGTDGVSTYFDAFAADAKGIGLQSFYPPDGLLTSKKPPLRSILWHNDVTVLSQRANIQKVPVASFGRYLFLLELSHNWGPAAQVPAPNAGELVGFPFHWSFFMDAGGSPAGGNQWKDNGDGTYTTIAADASKLGYSKLDLYLMGLAPASSVPPFGVLENVTVPATPTDPLWQGAYAAHSFPWFDASSSLTVTATRRVLTIDDVVTANGARDPAAGASPTSWKLGVVLLVEGTATADQVAAQKAGFDPIASGFAPAFHEATSGLGTLEVVTHDLGGEGGGGGAGGASSASSGSGGAKSAAGSGGSQASSSDGGGCSFGGAPGGEGAMGSLAVLAAAALVSRRRRSLARH